MASSDDNVSQRLVMSDQKPGYNKRKNEEQNNSKKLKLNDLSVHQISLEGDLDGSLSANKEHEHDKPESISEQELARNSHDKYKVIKSKEESSEPSSQSQDHHVSQRVVIDDKYKLKSTEEQISISEQQERELEDKLKQKQLEEQNLEEYALFLGLIQNPKKREIMDKAIKLFRECSPYALNQAVVNCFNIIFRESNNLIKELKSSGNKQQKGISRKYLNEKKQAKTKTNKMKVDGKLITILEELGLFPSYIEGLYELKEHRNKCVHELQFEIDKDDAKKYIILAFNILKKLPLNFPDDVFPKLIETMIGESKESTVIFDFQAEDNSLKVSVDDIVSQRVVIPEKYKSKSIEEQISICKQQKSELEVNLKQLQLIKKTSPTIL